VVLKIKQIKSHRCCGKVPWLLGGGREGKALMLKMDVIFCDRK
jgi:hypothetical protein